MALTVWGAFNAFREQSVDIASTTSNTARSSRDYLFEQLKQLDANQVMFPDMVWSSYLPYGSFARKTKIRPLDDIDIMILLNGNGTELRYSGSGYTNWLKITSNSAPLALFPDGQGYVNSTRILNQIKSSLASVKNYRKAEVKRTQQAVVLNLSSYEWVFDIVPAIAVKDWSGNVGNYLIPNGSGDWIRTDPRKDAEKITAVNLRHDGNFLPLIRILKYWNRRTHKPRLSSYYFETLAENYFSFQSASQHLPSAVSSFFQGCQSHLLTSCPDPKGLGPALDEGVEWSTKMKVREAMIEAAQRASFALIYEQLGKHKEAIYLWREIFGSEFPTYG